jgi:hypothetical protein
MRSGKIGGALIQAKARLDPLELYEQPVKLDHVRIVSAGWLFALPWFRRFDGYTMWNLIVLRRPELVADGDLVCHELCHVWQMQHHPIRMPLSYLRLGYAANPYEAQARRAAVSSAET